MSYGKEQSQFSQLFEAKTQTSLFECSILPMSLVAVKF